MVAYWWRTGAALCTVVIACPAPAASAPPDPLPSRLEIWAGAGGTSHAWSLYSGFTYAPFGPLAAEGWRLRIVAGYGEYHYRGGSAVGQATVQGTATFADALVGYQTRLGVAIIKAFAGVNADLHGLDPNDPDNAVSGDAIGWKLGFEGWLDVTPAIWTALDLSYASAHDSYASRVRFGYRLSPELSLGLEAGAFGNAESDSGRGGAFIRYQWLSGEISLSAGISGDIDQPTNPYGSVLWLTRY
ncbi:MAG TPA: cellulose biosynthesis protein BcsS [Hyphomicrobiaceae bacterium]|nr:cellulose biosynthesis protein BcsS [Hyphomicrobiaceae bacterium]